MKKIIWLSYDLGLKGDYNSLYRWLDTYSAKECGDSVANFKKDFKTNSPTTELLKELEENVSFNPSDRIYVVIVDAVTRKGEYASFIKGPRKRAPWEGYSAMTTDMSTDF